MSVLKWIWGVLQSQYRWIKHVILFTTHIFSSVLGWVLVGLAYLVHLVFQYTGEFFSNLFQSAESAVLPQTPTNGLANFLADDLLALPVAWECLVIFISVWIASRIARASFGAVRAIIDLL